MYFLFSVLCHFLALADEFLSHALVLRVWIFVNKSVALVLCVLEALQLLLLHTLLRQLKLTLHDKKGEFLTQFRIRIVLQRILRSDNASLIVVAAIGAVAEILSEVIIELSRVKLLQHELVLQFEEQILCFLSARSVREKVQIL